MSDYESDFDSPKDSPNNSYNQNASSPPSWLRPLNKKPQSREGRVKNSTSPTNRYDDEIPDSPVKDEANSPTNAQPERRYDTPSSQRSPTPYSSAHSSPRYVNKTPESSHSDVDRYSEPGQNPVAPARRNQWAAQGPPPLSVVEANPAVEIATLREKNKELQAAVDAVREQLSKIAPKLGANVKRKESMENERMNKLQAESLHLQQEHALLVKKLRDVEHVKDLEKQLALRESEVKTLQERNKFLNNEVRTNAKKLKQLASIEEHRAHQLTLMKQERKVAIQSLERAQRDAELAAQSKDQASKRLRELESKDRLPELKIEDVKQLIDMKNQLAAKQETIESLQYRLSVLKRAHESVNRTIVAQPSENAEMEALRAEIAGLRAKLQAQQGAPQDDDVLQPAAVPKSKPPSNKVANAKPQQLAPVKTSTTSAPVEQKKQQTPVSTPSSTSSKPQPQRKPSLDPLPEKQQRTTPSVSSSSTTPISRKLTPIEKERPAPMQESALREKTPPPAEPKETQKLTAASPESEAYTPFKDEDVDDEVQDEPVEETVDEDFQRATNNNAAVKNDNPPPPADRKPAEAPPPKTPSESAKSSARAPAEATSPESGAGTPEWLK